EAVSLDNFIAAIEYKLKLARKPSSHLFVSTSARDRNSELKQSGPSEEEEEVTFTPRIDPHSARLSELHRSRAGPIYDQLVAKKRMSQVRIEELRKEKEQRDMDGELVPDRVVEIESAAYYQIPMAKQTVITDSDEESDSEQLQDRQYKVILLGNGAVGKTSLAHRFCDGSFSTSYKQTIGLDFFVKRLVLPGDINVCVQVWDIGGQSIGSKMISR
ncbi:hypothetical protein FOZ62_008494, partial [Perkinsus olseni]